MNTNNGGFPPIQYIENKKITEENILLKERGYAPIPFKKLDIKHILSVSVKNKMINMDNRTINIVNSL